LGGGETDAVLAVHRLQHFAGGVAQLIVNFGDAFGGLAQDFVAQLVHHQGGVLEFLFIDDDGAACHESCRIDDWEWWIAVSILAKIGPTKGQMLGHNYDREF
jgi:hypothetical protein